MKAGARNRLTGTVREIKRGTLMGLAKVEVPAEMVVSSVMTLESLDELDLQEGDNVKVIIKAVNVLLVKE
jgi:molybdate transport system regulatory protein